MINPRILEWSHLFDGMSDKQICDFWKDHAIDLKELDDNQNEIHSPAFSSDHGLAGDLRPS